MGRELRRWQEKRGKAKQSKAKQKAMKKEKKKKEKKRKKKQTAVLESQTLVSPQKFDMSKTEGVTLLSDFDSLKHTSITQLLWGGVRKEGKREKRGKRN